MNLRRVLNRTLLGTLGFALLPLAHADTLVKSGTFAADNSTYSYNFSTGATTDYTFATTSYATGGFVPVLTLYSKTSGEALDNNGSGTSEAMLTDTLNAGSYVLYLTEFPNEAAGNLLSDGFQFANDPYITGQTLGLGNVSFIDDIDGSQRTDKYALDITSVAATPEPASWLMVLPGAGVVAYMSRRRRIA